MPESLHPGVLTWLNAQPTRPKQCQRPFQLLSMPRPHMRSRYSFVANWARSKRKGMRVLAAGGASCVTEPAGKGMKASSAARE